MSIFRRLANLFRRPHIDREIDAELRSHIALRIDDNLARGMSAEQARRDALLRFGNTSVIKERVVATDAALTLAGVGHDLRYASRQLRRSPGFAITAMVTLALGIGANVVVFGVLNSLLLRPLAVSDPGNLYQLRHQAWMKGRLLTTSYPAFEDLRQRNTTFSGLAGVYGYSHAALRFGNTVLSVNGDEVTGNYFDLLGVQPQAGRFFHETDEHGPGSMPCVVLSDTLWRRAFHSDPAIIGATVDLNRHPFTVVAVASSHFHGTERFVWPDYWVPMMNQQQISGWDSLHSRTSVSVTVLGRLRPGVTPRQATENLNAIAAQLAREYPQSDDGQALRLIHPGLLGDEGDVIRGFLWSVSLLALLVLAAACANLATLFAARAADRSRELALRMALGSTRSRLIRQLLTEAGFISFIGGAVGLLSALLLLAAINRSNSPYGNLEVSLDARVYLAGLAFTLASAVLFGIVPARQAWQSNPLQMMKSGMGVALHLRWFALRDLLLGAQIAICTLLVTASLVAVRGMVRQLHVPLGFEPHGALLVDLDFSPPALSQTDSASSTSTLEQQRALIDAARTIPGVTAVGAVSRTPMTGGLHGVPVFRPGTTNFTLNNAALAPYVFQMTPGFLAAAGTRLLSGRDVAFSDTAATPHIAVVNQTFARLMWGLTKPEASHAIGQHFIVAGSLTEVTGIVEDGIYHDLQEAPQPVAWLPFAQSDAGEGVIVVRSPRAPSEMAAALQRTMSGIAPNVPISVQSWSDTLDGEFFPAKAAAVALGVLGMLAAMLAVTGIFGMAAYSVSRRMRELGVRVALGARKPQVMRAAIGRPILLLGAGSMLGLLAGFFASRLLAQIVYQANPRDPIVIAGAVLTMAFLGVMASALPARRALAIDPARLMREE